MIVMSVQLKLLTIIKIGTIIIETITIIIIISKITTIIINKIITITAAREETTIKATNIKMIKEEKKKNLILIPGIDYTLN